MIFDLGVILLLYFAVLAWGSNELWAMAIIAIGSLVVLAGRLLWDAWHGKWKVPWSWVYLPLLLFLGYVGIQLLRVRTGLGKTTTWLPYTVEAHSTTLYLLLAAAYVALAFLVNYGFRSRTRVKWLIMCILILGVFESVYGLVQYLGNHHYIWDFEVTGNYARGTLINRNHYALLLNLTICTGVGFLYYRSMRILRGRNLTLRHVVSSPGSARLAWVVLLLAVMGLALVFSMSRMGIVALFACLGLMTMAGKAPHKSKRITIIGLSLVFAISSLAIYTGLDSVLERYETLAERGLLEKDRLPIWRDTWKMVQEYPIFGQGLGTFRWTFPAFESFEPDLPARYAHNDYLQSLTEVGLVGLLLLLWAFAACWRVAARNLLQSSDPLIRGIGLGTLGVMTATALQEITDFSLYIPGVATTFALLIGLNLRASHLTAQPPGHQDTKR